MKKNPKKTKLKSHETYRLKKKRETLKNQVLVHVTSMVSSQQSSECMHIDIISEQHDKNVLRLTHAAQ